MAYAPITSPTRRRLYSDGFRSILAPGLSIDHSSRATSTGIELDRLSQELLVRNATPIGKCSRKPLLTWKDIVALIITYLCLAASFTTVFNPQVAVWLGQTAQLQVVGLLLTVMGLCAAREVRFVALLMEVRFGRSSLQDYDYLLRNELFSREISLFPRTILLILLVMPLGLSVLYKSFSNGTSVVDIRSVLGNSTVATQFGIYAAPGLPWSGIGLSLVTNAYTPFWQNPMTNATYGYNLYAASDTTAAILDTPDPVKITQLQHGLRLGDSVTLEAAVNSTVSEFLDIPTRNRSDPGYWQCLANANYTTTSISLWLGTWAALMTSTDAETVYIGLFNASDWNVFDNDTFHANARAYRQTRRLCQGVWNITSDDIKLIHADILQTGDEAKANNDQTLIQSLDLDMYIWFANLLPEFNYLWFPRNSDMDTLPPLVASMMWGRIIPHNGPQNPMATNDSTNSVELVQYTKPAVDINMVKQSLTLKRSVGLVAVLCIQPLLATLAILVKMALHSIPIGDGFGLVAVLAGMRDQDLQILKGASLSGKLVRTATVQFVVGSEKDKDDGEDIVMVLDGHGPPQSLTRRTAYS